MELSLKKLLQKRVIVILLLFIMALIPLVLIYLPKTQFDTGPTTCLYTLVTGVNCLGCGMTRACMRLIHLDFKGAWEYNAMSFIVFPILAFYYARFFFSLFIPLIKDKFKLES